MTVLSSPTATPSQTSVAASVTTDEGTWHLYYAIRTSGPYGPGDEQIIKDGTGAVFASRLSNNLNPTGVNNVNFTGLDPSTTYYIGFVQEYNDTANYGPLWDYPLVFTPSTLPSSYSLSNDHIKKNQGTAYGFQLLSATPDPGTITCSSSGTLTVGAGTSVGTYELNIRSYNSDSRNDGEATVVYEGGAFANFYLLPEPIEPEFNGKMALTISSTPEAPTFNSVKFSNMGGLVYLEVNESADASKLVPTSAFNILFIEIMEEIDLMWKADLMRFEGESLTICQYANQKTLDVSPMPMQVTFRAN